MKKLMLVATAIAAGVAFGGDITSQNVVGYNTINKGTGIKYTMIGNNFLDVNGAAGVKFSDLKGDFQDYDEIQVVYMKTATKIDFHLYRYVVEEAPLYNPGGEETPCWIDVTKDQIVADTDILQFAKGVYFIAKSGDAEDVTMSGEVKNVAHTHTLDAKYSMLTIASPVAFNPQNSRFDWSLPDNTEIQTVYMKTAKKIDFKLYRYVIEEAPLYNPGGEETPCWVNVQKDEYLEDTITDPGEGFYLIIPAGYDAADYGFVESSVLN